VSCWTNSVQTLPPHGPESIQGRQLNTSK